MEPQILPRCGGAIFLIKVRPSYCGEPRPRPNATRGDFRICTSIPRILHGILGQSGTEIYLCLLLFLTRSVSNLPW